MQSGIYPLALKLFSFRSQFRFSLSYICLFTIVKGNMNPIIGALFMHAIEYCTVKEEAVLGLFCTTTCSLGCLFNDQEHFSLLVFLFVLCYSHEFGLQGVG